MRTKAVAGQTRDLVYGIRGDATSEHTVSFDGPLVRFCSASCLRQFTANPQLFLRALARARPWAAADTLAGRRHGDSVDRQDGVMPQLRRDPFTRGWVVVAPERGERPHQMPAGSRPVPGPVATDPSCPFCPGHEEDTPGELWRLPGRDSGWTVRVVPNRYPVLTPGVHPTCHHSDGPFIYADGVGSHEVVIESARHDWDLPDGDDAQVAAVLAAYRTRARALREQHPGLVLPFRNHGAAAGTSLPHPHSQLVATPIVPLRQRQLFDVARAYYDDHGSCLYVDVRQAELARGQRIVATSDHVVAFTPYASRVPYETWLVPRPHRASFADADDAVLADTAALLRRVLDALRSLLGDPPYNYVIISAPTGEEGSEYFLWHLQLLPRLTATAGFELGSGMAVTTVPPERAAAQLRDTVALTQ